MAMASTNVKVVCVVLFCGVYKVTSALNCVGGINTICDHSAGEQCWEGMYCHCYSQGAGGCVQGQCLHTEGNQAGTSCTLQGTCNPGMWCDDGGQAGFRGICQWPNPDNPWAPNPKCPATAPPTSQPTPTSTSAPTSPPTSPPTVSDATMSPTTTAPTPSPPTTPHPSGSPTTATLSITPTTSPTRFTTNAPTTLPTLSPTAGIPPSTESAQPLTTLSPPTLVPTMIPTQFITIPASILITSSTTVVSTTPLSTTTSLPQTLQHNQQTTPSIINVVDDGDSGATASVAIAAVVGLSAMAFAVAMYIRCHRSRENRKSVGADVVLNSTFSSGDFSVLKPLNNNSLFNKIVATTMSHTITNPAYYSEISDSQSKNQTQSAYAVPGNPQSITNNNNNNDNNDNSNNNNDNDDNDTIGGRHYQEVEMDDSILEFETTYMQPVPLNQQQEASSKMNENTSSLTVPLDQKSPRSDQEYDFFDPIDDRHYDNLASSDEYMKLNSPVSTVEYVLPVTHVANEDAYAYACTNPAPTSDNSHYETATAMNPTEYDSASDVSAPWPGSSSEFSGSNYNSVASAKTLRDPWRRDTGATGKTSYSNRITKETTSNHPLENANNNILNLQNSDSIFSTDVSQ